MIAEAWFEVGFDGGFFGQPGVPVVGVGDAQQDFGGDVQAEGEPFDGGVAHFDDGFVEVGPELACVRSCRATRWGPWRRWGRARTGRTGSSIGVIMASPSRFMKFCGGGRGRVGAGGWRELDFGGEEQDAGSGESAIGSGR